MTISEKNTVTAREFADKIRQTEGIKAIYLHGSNARGEATKRSDIDILIHGEIKDNDWMDIVHEASGMNIHLFLCTDLDIRERNRKADVVLGRHPSVLL